MNYTIQRLPKSEIEIQVTLPFSEFEPHIKKAAVLISEEIEVEGFRKGKAPYDVVVKRVGETAIYERAAELAARKTYPEILRELVTRNQLSATTPTIGRPEVIITKLAPNNDLEYKTRTAVLPVVTLPNYRAIAGRLRKEKNEQSVSEEEINQAIQWLRESRTQLITIDRPAAERDRVEIDFEIRSGGVNPHTKFGVGVKIAEGDSTPLEVRPAESGTAAASGGLLLTGSKNHPILIGAGKFIPGFENQLIGMKSGEQKSFTLSVPEDWHEKGLAGKALDFTATMKLVQERRMPELTDEFAKGMGSFATLDALKASVREGLLNEKIDKEKQRIRGLIIAQIATEAKTELPEVLLQAEIDKMIAELKSAVAEMAMKWEDYLLHIGKTEESLRADWLQEAERRVRIALCLREIAAKERIEPSEEEITGRADQILRQFRTGQEAERAIDPVRSSPPEAAAVPLKVGRTSNGVDPNQLREYTKGVLRNEKVFEFLEVV